MEKNKNKLWLTPALIISVIFIIFSLGIFYYVKQVVRPDHIKATIERNKKNLETAKKENSKRVKGLERKKRFLAQKLSNCRKHTVAPKYTVDVDDGSRRRRLLGRGRDGNCR